MDTQKATEGATVICSSENRERSWKWLEPAFSRDEIRFIIYDCSNPRKIESLVARPYLPRYSAAWKAARRAAQRDADMLVSFGPTIAGFTEHFCRARRRRPFHLAFAFNYTNLPTGWRRASARSAFRTIDRFVVASTAERALYADYFDLDPRRFDILLWGIRRPSVPAEARRIVEGDYVCAIGGEGRDYGTLFEAARSTPRINYVVVARQYSLGGLTAPPNVRLLVNIPMDSCWTLLQQSRFMALPLRDSLVPCGHVTLVAAMHLRKAIVATDSSGIADYVRQGDNALMVPSNDPRAMGEAIERLMADPALAEDLAARGEAFAQSNCSEESTIRYFKELLRQRGLVQ